MAMERCFDEDKPERRAAELMRFQLGVISRSQALAAGLTEGAIEHRIASGRWVVVLPSIYRAAEVPESWEQSLVAALLLGDETAVLSHRSAAAFHDLRGIERLRPEISVLTNRQSGHGVIVHRVHRLDAADVKIRGPFRVTSSERTILDLAAVVDPRTLENALDSALKKGLTSPRRLADYLAGRVGLRGIARLRKLVRPRLEGQLATDSDMEILFANLLRRYDLPRPVTQYGLADSAGSIGTVDAAYPGAILLIELDGYEYHSDLQRWRADRARDRRLQASGWRVLRYTWWDLTQRPQEVAEEIRSFLAPYQSRRAVQ